MADYKKALNTVWGFVRPALEATLDTAKIASRDLRFNSKVAGVGVSYGVQAYGSANAYRQMQEDYQGKTGRTTSDMAERQARDSAPNRGLFKKIGAALDDANEFRKIAGLAGQISTAGNFSTPLQVYSLLQGDYDAYAAFAPKKKEELKMTVAGIEVSNIQEMLTVLQLMKLYNMNPRARAPMVNNPVEPQGNEILVFDGFIPEMRDRRRTGARDITPPTPEQTAKYGLGLI
jgi:hypothetical protein